MIVSNCRSGSAIPWAVAAGAGERKLKPAAGPECIGHRPRRAGDGGRAATHLARVEELVADAIKQPREAVAAARTRLVDAGLLDTDGSLTGSGLGQSNRCRELVFETTQALTAGIDPAAVQTTLDTLDAVRTPAEELIAGWRSQLQNDPEGRWG